jgi:hypothetical protein
MIADGQPLTVVARFKISQTEMGQMEVGVYNNSFVVEEADDSTILVRHILAGVRFLFVIKGRTFDGQAGQEPNPSDLSLRNQARAFALREARTRGWVD